MTDKIIPQKESFLTPFASAAPTQLSPDFQCGNGALEPSRRTAASSVIVVHINIKTEGRPLFLAVVPCGVA